jgi:hypothetical protein
LPRLTNVPVYFAKVNAGAYGDGDKLACRLIFTEQAPEFAW